MCVAEAIRTSSRVFQTVAPLIPSTSSHYLGYMKRVHHVLSCLTLCDSMGCSPPGSFVHEMFQARILDWVSISYSRRSSRPRDLIYVSCISCMGRQILYHCTTKETQDK